MRFAISSISSRGGKTKASDVCAFVRGCKSGKSSVPFLPKYFHNKITFLYDNINLSSMVLNLNFSFRFRATNAVRTRTEEKAVRYHTVPRKN